jgi:hypothetical protein
VSESELLARIVRLEAFTGIGPPTAPVSSRLVPLVGKSGLGYNSILFQGGPADLAQMRSFGIRRGGVLVDGGLTFVPRDSWGSLKNAEYVQAAKAIIDDGGIVVFRIPHAPESEGNDMNSKGAANKYLTAQRSLASYYADNGLNSNRFILSIDWEFNGSWYPWSANRGGGPANLKASIFNAVTNFRAGGLTNARYGMCANSDKTQSGANLKDVFPGSNVIDVVGIDVYDQWMPSFTQADWDSKSRRTEGIQTVIDFARANGIMWSVDEGANVHGDGNMYGGDNPLFYKYLYSTVRANLADCAWVNTYDHEGSDPSFHHDLASNPLSWAEYLRQMQIHG